MTVVDVQVSENVL